MTGTRLQKNETVVWKKEISTITFSNSTGTISALTVTGDVEVDIVPICKATLTSAAAGNIRLGIPTNTDAMIADTTATDLNVNQIWIDTSPDSLIEPKSASRAYILSNGEDVTLTMSAQIDTGAITFACFWRPISLDGAVVPA